MTNVRIVRDRFENLEPNDCLFTAGNAFGLMRAGIDAAIVGRSTEPLIQRVQHRIMNGY